MIDMKRLFGRNVSGALTDKVLYGMKWDIEDAKMPPTVRAVALAVLDGLSGDEVWRHLHETLGSDMSRSTAGWYISRAYAVMHKLFKGRLGEFGLNIAKPIVRDMRTSELAKVLGIAPCTLRGKMEKAQELGLPMPKRMLGRTLRRGQYIFPQPVAAAWARAYMDGKL